MSQGHLYCEKHQLEMGAAGCIKCIMEKLSVMDFVDMPDLNGGTGSAAGGMRSAASFVQESVTDPVYRLRKQQEQAFFEENKAFHEKQQRERRR